MIANTQRIILALAIWLAPVTGFAQNGGGTQDLQFSQSLTAPGTVIITTDGQATVSVVATGNGAGLTFAFQGTNDGGTTWTTLLGVVPSTNATATSFSANGTWVVSAAGFQTLRVNLTAISGGTETFALAASARTARNIGNPGTVTSIATTSPITGGTITTAGTIACATCVTSAAALTANSIMIGAGSQASAITLTGSGVLTALGINVGSAGAFVVNGGALGTPSSGTATNLTGTAAGLTAGSVTTNANLTGPITSVGNATSIASQTGTGTKFVVDTSPTLVTPVLGVATGTSIALTPGNASSTVNIGQWAAFAGYGALSFNGSLTVGGLAGIVGSATDLNINYLVPTGGVHTWRINGASIATLDATGLGVAGLATGAAVTMVGLTAASGTPSSICQNSATKEITVNAALTCTVSSLAFKHDFESIQEEALLLVMAMRPGSFFYNDSPRQRLGFAAEYMAAVDYRLGDGWDRGRPRSIDQNAILAVVVKALQELKADNDNLREEVRFRGTIAR